MQGSIKRTIVFAISALAMIALAACIEVRAVDDGADPDVDPVPTETPTPDPAPDPTPEATPEATPEPTPEATPEATPEPTPEATPEPTPDPPTERTDIDHDVVVTEKTLPEDTFESRIDVATSAEEFEDLWEQYQFEGTPPDIDFDESTVIVVGTGESSSCPLELINVEYDAAANQITITVGEDVDEDTACTDDWTPRAWVITVPSAEIDPATLDVSLEQDGRTPGEVFRLDVGWYSVIASEKNYPMGQIGEEILRLAEDEETFVEFWDWMQLEATAPMIDWETQVVLFVGVGESGGCPVDVESVEFDEENRLIEVTVAMEGPDDMVCTADWTPRAFVIVLDREELGDGELRALINQRQFGKEMREREGEVIRQG